MNDRAWRNGEGAPPALDFETLAAKVRVSPRIGGGPDVGDRGHAGALQQGNEIRARVIRMSNGQDQWRLVSVAHLIDNSPGAAAGCC